MTFPPSAGAGPGESQINLFVPKTQNSQGFWSSLFLILFCSSQKNRIWGLVKTTPLFYTNAHSVLWPDSITHGKLAAISSTRSRAPQ